MMRRICTEEIAYAWDKHKKAYKEMEINPQILVYSDHKAVMEYLTGLCAQISDHVVTAPEELDPQGEEDLWLICWLDCSDEKYLDRREQKKAYQEVNRILRECPAGRLKKVLCCVGLSSDMLPWQHPQYQYAEYELGLYFRDCEAGSRENFVYKMENWCRKVQRGTQAEVFVLRMLNVTNGAFENPSSRELRKLVSEAEKEKCVPVDQELAVRYYTSMRNVMNAILLILRTGKAGNIYQLAGWRTDRGYLQFMIYERLKHQGVDCTLTSSGERTEDEIGLSTLKLRGLGWRAYFEERRLAYELIDSFAAYNYADYDREQLLSQSYTGQLELIKRLEMKVMREIDRICKKHDIQYFLVGGSLLGAVRHKGFIPWDDDLDIGMLREDFERFRRICPRELGEDFFYQSYRTEKGSHYIFDKVRLKNTFFSTKFSNMFDIENGIFIDILVYDKTSNDPKEQERHIKMLTTLTTVINIRWVNYARQNIHYILSKLCLPFMRLIPFRLYHALFEHVLKKYRKSQTSEYLIDGVGQNITRGAFPREWVEEIIELPFEDMMLPAPAKYHEYLVHWYGENYMSIPALVNQFSGHVLSRIDLGEYIYGNDKKSEKVNVKGELF